MSEQVPAILLAVRAYWRVQGTEAPRAADSSESSWVLRVENDACRGIRESARARAAPDHEKFRVRASYKLARRLQTTQNLDFVSQTQTSIKLKLASSTAIIIMWAI